MVKDTTNFLHNEEIFSYVHQLPFWEDKHKPLYIELQE